MSAGTAVLFAVGFVLLVVGAQWLVRGSARLALGVGISPLVVGLTVVAIGTSSPELAVSVQSALNRQPDLALGNVVGSNILNVLLILGLAALVRPLTITQQLIRQDVPLVVAASALLWLFALDGRVARPEGAALFVGAVLYIGFVIRQSRKESAAVRGQYEREFAAPVGLLHRARSPLRALLLPGGLIVAGLALLVLGSHWLVDGAVAFARLVGVSDLVIGLTVVAIGTSLPEIATTVLADRHGHRDIAVGNVIGSNLSNILLVLGLTALVAPGGVTVPRAALAFDLPVMVAVTAACLPVFYRGSCIARWEGALFLTYYMAYTAYQILAAAQSEALPPFRTAMLLFVLPLTAVTLFYLALQQLRANRKA